MIKIIETYEEALCWWCGKPADSKEHRHKKSDVKLIFGDKFEGEPVIIRGNYSNEIQGPNSNLLKFEKVLCKICNNNRSQPFDRAYSSFVSYVLGNYDEILNSRIIDFNNITKTDAIGFKYNIYRYLTKVFCCRLASNNISIKPEIIDFLNFKKPIKFLYFKFEIRPDIYAFLNRAGAEKLEGNVYLSPLRYNQSIDSSQIEFVYQFYNLQWLRIYTFYSEQMTEEIYTGYKKYSDLTAIQIEARYFVNPDRLFDEGADTVPKENEKNKWLEEYLNIDIFKF